MQDSGKLNISIWRMSTFGPRPLGGEKKVPFNICDGEAKMCDLPNTFIVALKDGFSQEFIQSNLYLSIDCKLKWRFQAEADSFQDARDWCEHFNKVKLSLNNWERDKI